MDGMTKKDTQNKPQHDERGYEPSAADPGPALLWGTVGICSFLLFFTLCFLRRRKYRRSLKKAKLARDALQEDLTEDINENIFQKRVKKKNGRRLRGWNEIAKTIKRGKTVQVGTETRKGPRETTDVSDVLEKDLFEQDGIVDKLTTPLGVRFRSSDTATSPSGSQQDGVDDGCTASSGSTGISSDYSLMSDQYETTIPSVFQVFFSLFSNDRETKKLLKLVILFSISALFSSSFGVLMMVAIGRVLGTQELTAYVMVYYVIGVPTMLLDGMLSTLTTVCSQSVGAGKPVLAGLYVQMAITLYLFLFIPIAVAWWNYFDNVMIWLDFDEDTSRIAPDYAKVYVVLCVVDALQRGLFLLLEVCNEQFAKKRRRRWLLGKTKVEI